MDTPAPLTADEILSADCTFCGKVIRSHCIARECRYTWRMCNEGILASVKGAAEHWDGRHTAGLCHLCGQGIRHHYRHQVSVAIFDGQDIHTKTELVRFPFPIAFLGCPARPFIWI